MSQIHHIAGTTFHGRKGSVENAFSYGVDYVMLDPEASALGPALFSRNGGNLVSLWDRDHGGAPKDGSGAAWFREVLAAHGLADVVERVALLAQPRVLGHVFNPVSFWLGFDANGGLRVVVPEVSNTYGDRHSYLCAHEDQRIIAATDTLTATKIFYVSPFQPVEGGYKFRFDIRDDKIGIWIDYNAGENGLLATLTGKRAPLSNTSILRACLRRPLGSRRVLGLIHWQAFKLWWKGAMFRTRPVPPTEDVSR
ncbi:DUF1365 domain-containing protein [uncultured Litoreibacter sp.]|uniref:DUF1365 domain-containing protein n=1 Tax=uncultured Litoreibacter sp. TaxID=1392394 RepID=UPI00260202D2|nr:DUF1365 domain-containing protein [uncultured Litoreibacter sp.]